MPSNDTTYARNVKQRSILMRSEAFQAPQAASALVQTVIGQIKEATPDAGSWFDYYSGNHSTRIAFDLTMVEQYVEKGTPIVEFGSSPLLLTGAMVAQGHSVTGVDIDPSRYEDAARQLHLDIVKCDVERGSFPFANETFGVAIFNEIFEHLRIDLIHTFNEIRRVMKPGGLLLLSTPNGRSYANLVNLLIHDNGLDTSIYSAFEGLSSHGYLGHVREYTATDVIDFLEAVGFCCEEVVFRGRFATNMGQVAARLIPSLRPFFSVIARRL